MDPLALQQFPSCVSELDSADTPTIILITDGIFISFTSRVSMSDQSKQQLQIHSLSQELRLTPIHLNTSLKKRCKN